ncbi:TPA: DUF3265 domain-containing protein [Vibrio vulnificus]|nr:DUF3265 domain-containing protein [Vibrio vulnificus]
MTRRSRGIHAAWHFWFAVSFSGESGLRKVGLGGIHPLTRRYATKRKSSMALFFALSGHRLSGVGNSALSAQVLESLRP